MLSATGSRNDERRRVLGRRSRIAIALTLLFVGLVAAGFIFLVTLDFNAFKGAISDAVRDATGRELSIAGDVALSRSLPPVLSISDVTFANAPWGARSPMVNVGELQVQVALLALLKRQLVFKRLDLSGTTVFLETDAKGQGNWELEKASDPGTGDRWIRDVQLRHVHINDLNFNFRNGRSGWKTQFELASLAVDRPPAAKQASVELSGAWQGQPVALAGSVGRLVDAQAGKPFPVDLSGEVLGGNIGLSGDIADLFNLTGFDLKLEASGTNLAELSIVAEVKLPKTDSYNLTAKLQGSRETLEVTELKGTTRSGDVGFDVSGTIGDLTALSAVALQLQVSGPDLSLVGPMIDVTLAKTGPFSASGRLTGSGEELAFKDARVKLSHGGLSLRLEGDINDVIGVEGVDLSLEATGPNLAEFGQVIRNELPDTGAFKISGQLTGSYFGKLALGDANAKLDWGGVSLTATGAVADLQALGDIDLKATAAGTSLAQVGRLLDQSWPSTGPFAVSGRLTGRKDALAVRDAKARVSHGGLTLAATGTVDNVMALSGVNVSFDAAGNDLADIGSMVKQTLPQTGPFRVRGRIKGSRERLTLVDTRGTVSHGSAKLSLEGNVADLIALEGVNFQVTASGEEAAELSPLIGKELPELGSFKVTGDLSGSAAELVLGNAFALVGHSDASGTVSVALDDRPKVTVRLDSGLIDYTPFMAAVKEDETQHEETEPSTKGAPLFSDKSLGLDALGKFDADVVLRMRRILARDAELEFGHLVLSLINGELKLSTLEATYKGAKISGHAQIDPESPPRVATDFLVQGFDLGRFLADTHTTEGVKGLLDIAVDVNSQGDSVQALVANLDGSVALVMGKGRASRYLDLLAEDLSTRVFTFWRHRKEAARVECGVVQFDSDHGVATSRAFVFVTEAAIIKAEGDINLDTEKINLLLIPKPRHASLVSLATKLRVTGSLTAPKVRPDTLDLAEKGAKLLSTLAIGPLGLLAPFVHLGAHDKHPCDIKAIDDKLLATPALRKDAAAETRSPR
jgi:uncharacterized protein involved in outer membrane biogenesis